MRSLSKKVCLLGDFAVGKTSLVRRFVHNLYGDKYLSTIGVKVSRKEVVLPYQEQIISLNMMLWDMAGSEEFDQVRTSYLRGASGAVLVCDVTRSETLTNLYTLTAELRATAPGIHLVMAANKVDLSDPRYLSQAQVADVAAELNMPHYLTSAKTGDEVEVMFRKLGELVLT